MFSNPKKNVSNQKRPDHLAPNEPRDAVAAKRLSRILKIKQDKRSSLIMLQLKWHDEQEGADMLNAIVAYANEYLAKREQDETFKRISDMEVLLKDETMPEMKKLLIAQIETLSTQQMTQGVELSAAFEVLDEAWVTENVYIQYPKIRLIKTFVFSLVCIMGVLMYRRYRYTEMEKLVIAKV